MFYFYAQHIPLFLPIMLNWPIKGNLPYVDEMAGTDGESRGRIHLRGRVHTGNLRNTKKWQPLHSHAESRSLWFMALTHRLVLKWIRTASKANTKFLSGHEFLCQKFIEHIFRNYPLTFLTSRFKAPVISHFYPVLPTAYLVVCICGF